MITLAPAASSSFTLASRFVEREAQVIDHRPLARLRVGGLGEGKNGLAELDPVWQIASLRAEMGAIPLDGFGRYRRRQVDVVVGLRPALAAIGVKNRNAQGNAALMLVLASLTHVQSGQWRRVYWRWRIGASPTSAERTASTPTSVLSSSG